MEVDDWDSEGRQDAGSNDAMPGSSLEDSLLFESKRHS